MATNCKEACLDCLKDFSWICGINSIIHPLLRLLVKHRSEGWGDIERNCASKILLRL
jgi:hypothetical protein